MGVIIKDVRAIIQITWATGNKNRYGPRQFAGRFLGHGTPFKSKDGKWWYTAFYNANIPPLTREQARGKDLPETAQTINQQGVTIVPLEIKLHDDGRFEIRAKAPDYSKPRPGRGAEFHTIDTSQTIYCNTPARRA